MRLRLFYMHVLHNICSGIVLYASSSLWYHVIIWKEVIDKIPANETITKVSLWHLRAYSSMSRANVLCSEWTRSHVAWRKKWQKSPTWLCEEKKRTKHSVCPYFQENRRCYQKSFAHTDPPAARAVRSSSRRSPSFPTSLRFSLIVGSPELLASELSKQSESIEQKRRNAKATHRKTTLTFL